MMAQLTLFPGLLNGGIFHDRALIADGRNVDSWVLVKQHVAGPTSSPQSPNDSGHAASPAQYTSSLMSQAYSGISEVGAPHFKMALLVIPCLYPCTDYD
jgi:hypothetical protein